MALKHPGGRQRETPDGRATKAQFSGGKGEKERKKRQDAELKQNTERSTYHPHKRDQHTPYLATERRRNLPLGRSVGSSIYGRSSRHIIMASAWGHLRRWPVRMCLCMIHRRGKRLVEKFPFQTIVYDRRRSSITAYTSSQVGSPARGTGTGTWQEGVSNRALVQFVYSQKGKSR